MLACLAAVALPAAGRADAILTWNTTLLDVVRQTSPLLVDGPPEVAREMAILDTAMFDAVNAATGLTYHPYGFTGAAVSGASADAAALAAGQQAMTAMFSSPLWRLPLPAGAPAIADRVLARIDATYAAALAGLNQSDPAVTKGLALGRSAASDVLGLRHDDGATAAILDGLKPHSAPGSGIVPGVYVPPSASGGRPAMMPRWGDVEPFGVTRNTIRRDERLLPTVMQFGEDGRAGFIRSPQYALDVLRTECTGSAGPLPAAIAGACATAGFHPATASEVKAALFWNDPGGTMQPPGHWLQIADTVMTQPGRQLDELQEARLSALLGMAEADAGIAAWDVKYRVNLWRPVTAIRDCRAWNAFFTTCDPAWTSLIATPPHPDYVAGHPAFSGAAATVLADFFGTDDIAFCSTSDPYRNGALGPVGPLTECFDSFSAASFGPNGAEASRVAGGIHTSAAVADGLRLGEMIGAEEFAGNLRPVPETGTLPLLLAPLAVLLLLQLPGRRMSIFCSRAVETI